MPKDTSKTLFRGLGIMHPHYTVSTLWPSESSYTQKGPRAGVPVPQQATDLVLKTLGTQTASTEITTSVQRGGFPGYGQTAGEGFPGTIVWKRSTDGATAWRGWDGPTAICGFEVIDQSNGAHINPSVITLLDSGDVMQLGSNDNAGETEIRVRTRNSATGVWGATVLVHTTPVSGTWGGFADITQLNDGTLVVVVLDELNPGSDQGTLTTYTSKDEGATWDLTSKGASSAASVTSANYTFRRMRLEANKSGELLCLLWGTRSSGTHVDHLFQFASRDGGSNFDLVQLLQGATGGGTENEQSATGDIAVIDNTFIVASMNPSTLSSGQGVHIYRLGSAYDSIPTDGIGLRLSTIELVESVAGDNRCALVATPSGALHLFSFLEDLVGGDSREIVRTSLNGGVSWQNMVGGSWATVKGVPSGTWYQGGVTSIHPRNYAATWHRGRVLLVCNHVDAVGTDDDNLTGIYLGGFSTVTRPFIDSPATAAGAAKETPAFQQGWERNYLPFDLPQNDGWSETNTGTNTATISGGVLNITTTSGRRNWLIVPADDQRILVESHIEVTSGTGTAVRWQVDDGSTLYAVAVEVTTTAINIIQDPGGTPSTLATSAYAGGDLEIKSLIDTGAVSVWWRPASTTEEKADWTKITGTAVDLGSVGASELVRFGLGLGPSVSTAAMTVKGIHVSSGDAVGPRLASFTNPDGLQGFPIPSGSAHAEYIAEGVRLFAVSGPGLRGEQHKIATRYDKPIERIYPTTSPSPRVGWESATDAEGMAIAWRMSEGFDSRAFFGTMYLSLRAVNWRQAQLQYRAGGSWSDHVEIVNYVDLTAARIGNVIYPGTSLGDPGRYYQENELAGGFVRCKTGGSIREIISNTAGWFRSDQDSKLCTILIKDADNTEDVSGGVEVWFPNVTIIFASRNAEAWRLQIHDDGPGAPGTLSGTFKIGVMSFGTVYPFGCDYAAERTLGIETNTELVTADDGSRFSRVLGPIRRTVQAFWGVMYMGWFSGSASEDDAQHSIRWNATGNYNVVRDEPLVLPGLLERLRGSDVPLMYFPRLDQHTGSSSSVTYTDQRNSGALYGRLVSGIRLTGDKGGEEEESEGLGGLSFTFEEEV